jgi:hypothetical protein
MRRKHTEAELQELFRIWNRSTQMCFISVVIAFGAKPEISDVSTDRLESTRCVSVRPYGETGRNRTIPGTSEDLASREKPIFFRVDRMRHQFHHRLASQREDSLQTDWRFQRC